MVLYVIRHGKAEPSAPSGRDRDRALRPKGIRQSAYLGQALHDAAPRPSLIVTSTYRRARQTGELINQTLGAEFISDTRLCVDEPVSLAIDLIAEHAGRDAMCVVGHNPQLESLCGLLAGGMGASPARVRTGEAFAFRIDASDPLSGGELVGRWRLSG